MKVVALLFCVALFAFVAPASAQMSATHRTTSDGRPLASSLPPKPGAARTQARPMEFQELSQHVGARVILTTIYGEKREGRVEGVAGSTLRLRTSAGLGYAVTNFERAKVRSLTLLP